MCLRKVPAHVPDPHGGTTQKIAKFICTCFPIRFMWDLTQQYLRQPYMAPADAVTSIEHSQAFFVISRSLSSVCLASHIKTV
jgi:hypothetical protein